MSGDAIKYLYSFLTDHLFNRLKQAHLSLSFLPVKSRLCVRERGDICLCCKWCTHTLYPSLFSIHDSSTLLSILWKMAHWLSVSLSEKKTSVFISVCLIWPVENKLTSSILFSIPKTDNIWNTIIVLVKSMCPLFLLTWSEVRKWRVELSKYLF